MMGKLIPVLALMIPLFGACGDIEITVPEDFCFFCVGDGPPPHQFVVSGTVNLAGAPAAVRLELVAAAAGTVVSTISSSAPDGRYDNLYGPRGVNVCSGLEVRATLDVSARQMAQELSDETGLCRPGARRLCLEEVRAWRGRGVGGSHL